MWFALLFFAFNISDSLPIISLTSKNFSWKFKLGSAVLKRNKQRRYLISQTLSYNYFHQIRTSYLSAKLNTKIRSLSFFLPRSQFALWIALSAKFSHCNFLNSNDTLRKTPSKKISITKQEKLIIMVIWNIGKNFKTLTIIIFCKYLPVQVITYCYTMCQNLRDFFWPMKLTSILQLNFAMTNCRTKL